MNNFTLFYMTFIEIDEFNSHSLKHTEHKQAESNKNKKFKKNFILAEFDEKMSSIS